MNFLTKKKPSLLLQMTAEPIKPVYMLQPMHEGNSASMVVKPPFNLRGKCVQLNNVRLSTLHYIVNLGIPLGWTAGQAGMHTAAGTFTM